MENKLTIKNYFSQDNVKAKFTELLGKKSVGFVTSVLQVVNQNDLLRNATPESVFHSAAVAATLDLPINQNLGFAYIVPYNAKQKDGTYKTVAQFQMGYKGFIQLAQRSGQFKTISATPIYEGQLIEENPLIGFKFDFSQKKSDLVIGYAAYFQLLNGFEKTLYMSVQEVSKHGKKYSQTFKKGFGLWKDEFDTMATKTVMKLLLSKFAPLSIEMQKAMIYDQAIVKDSESDEVEYIDNEIQEVDKEQERIALMIEDAQSVEDLESIEPNISEDQSDLFNQKKQTLKTKTNEK